MNIYGIGTDIVKCERIAKLWAKYGYRFAQKILTPHELDVLKTLNNNQVAFLAKRFAAKEAVAKALGTGFRNSVLLTQIGVVTDVNGKPLIMLYGATKAYVDSLGDFDIHLSLSDETEHVISFVIILKK